jgi:hypothetical protein
MSGANPTLKQKLLRGMAEFLVIVLYLFVVLALFDIYRWVILEQQRLELLPVGLALVNALALGKVILIGQELHLADRFRDSPLIYPTLLKSLVYTVLLTCFKLLEGAGVALYRHKPVSQDIVAFAGGSWRGVLALAGLLFVVLIPFFAFTELRRVFGEDRIIGAFFRPRNFLDLPTAHSEPAV